VASAAFVALYRPFVTNDTTPRMMSTKPQKKHHLDFWSELP
jgi:hypothetical protein